jgi:serine/threonine protein kinase
VLINSAYTITDFSHQQFGNYRLIQLLGHGSFASVYLGEHLYLKRLAAIKVLRTVLSAKETRLFLEEAKILANLSHPHIVRVLEFAVAQRWTTVRNNKVQENTPFLVLDYAAGGTLRTRYPDGTRLSPGDVVRAIKQVAEALQYAHDCNVIHRDIKPENLLLNERQEVMLSDFGLAVFAPTPDFQSLQDIAGTLPYAAPEQLQGKPGFASDQYSLGIITYEWLCGSRPFQGNDVEIIMQQISSPPPPLRRKDPSISRAVEDVILRALAKEPQQRFRNVQTFAHALESASQVRDLRPFTMPMNAAESPPYRVLEEIPYFHFFAQKDYIASYTPKEAPPEPGSPVVLPEPRSPVAINQLMARRSSSMQRNRQRMIKKVSAVWIRGVLRQSLLGASFIPPGLDERQDAVARRSSQQAVSHIQPFAPGTTIVEVYDQTAGELLILGEAGSGKTTLLLELARHLLDRAELDESMPIPVIFLLSSWSEKQLPLEEWFIEELSCKYQVPRPLGELWVRNEMLLPLLDGLDEVAVDARSACVTAINTYKKEHGLTSLVVCSRLTDYLLTPSRVFLQSAVVLRPLTGQQIENYLRSAGEKFDVILRVLQADQTLQKLITTPLMLNIITLAYRDKSPEELMTISSSAGRYRRILSTYVEQMLQRRPLASTHEQQQLIHWLTYLANQMQLRNQRIFCIEYVQPDWIPGRFWQYLYRFFAILLPGALIGALVGLVSNVLLFHTGIIGSIFIDTVYGIVMGYLLSGRGAKQPSAQEPPASSAHTKKSLLEYLQTALVIGLVTFFFIGQANGWSAGLANGIFLGLLSFPLNFIISTGHKKAMRSRATPPKRRQKSLTLQHLRNGALVGIPCGLTSIISVLINASAPQHASIAFFLSLGIRDSLRNGLIGGFLSFLLVNNDGFIHLAEVISWSWKYFWRSIKNLKSLVYSPLVGFIAGLIFASKQLLQGDLITATSMGVSTGVLITISLHVTFVCVKSISSRHLPDQHRFRQNEGIRRSLKHGLIFGAVGMFSTIFLCIVTVILTVASIYGPATLQPDILFASVHLGLSNSLLLAPCAGLLAWLLAGGLAFLQYSILRFVLRCTGVFPSKLSRFMDYAADGALLHRVGSGYIFTHRLLLEYFVSLDRRGQSPEKQTTRRTEPLVKLLDIQA